MRLFHRKSETSVENHTVIRNEDARWFKDKYYQLTIGETGEWGSKDATSAGPPVEYICRQIDKYTATNLLILWDAIQDELERRLSR